MELLQRSFRLPLLLFLIVAAAASSYLISPAAANLVLNRVDRRVDLTSQIVRIASSLKVHNSAIPLCYFYRGIIYVGGMLGPIVDF
jgi:uncharacterized membrane protein